MSVSLAGTKVGLDALADRLLVQCVPDDVDTVLPLLHHGSGLLITGERATTAADRATSLSSGNVLVDRARYAGAARLPAASPLSSAWVDSQLAAGCTVPLTDSGYVGAGDRAGLAALLTGAAALSPTVVAVLPVHRTWLATDVTALIDDVNAHDVPVALVVEHRDDPFRLSAVLRGLVRLLDEATVPVMLLRSDLSALGAVAHGALAGAFGVRSSLRHLFEPPKPGKGFRIPTPVPAALWKPGLYMVKVDRLAAAHARTPDDPMWLCECATCRGRTVDWLHLDASGDEVLAHTLEILLGIRGDLAMLPVGPMRRQSWRAQCASAEFQFSDVATMRVGWTVPPSLRWWQAV